ncbi:MAG: VWA domain-containing protein [Planctomycetes bacterium]|nr:VWA domain-containing protein [Planctomycetota bacterium]
MIIATEFHFTRPWWLLATVVVLPLVWMAWRNLASLGRVRQIAAIVCRAAVVALLAALLSEPVLNRTHEQLSVIAIIDQSQSVPLALQESAKGYLAETLSHKKPADRLGVIYTAESAGIASMASTADQLTGPRTLGLSREQTDLASGVQLAMAIAPPDTAVRMLLISDGNQTTGDLAEAAKTAAANKIPIDVLPLLYDYEHEVVFKNLLAPRRARSGQTISLRFVLTSTTQAAGRLMLTLNGEPVALDGQTGEPTMPVEFNPVTNVRTVSLPVGSAGVHEFEATFIPDSPGSDELSQNNVASCITFVAGEGHVRVVDTDPQRSAGIVQMLRSAGIDARGWDPSNFPDRLAELLDKDAILLVDVHNSDLSLSQQEVLQRYVEDLGGGLVVAGGPNSFGAGGWIGSPLAEILPVDLDPPQKKQMPKGALVLIMHACEMPNGNYWSKEMSIAAIKSLSRLDLVGVVEYAWGSGGAGWVYPLGPVGDKVKAIAAVKNMQMGDMPDFGGPMQAAYAALQNCQAGQKHMIMISDGDPSPPSPSLLSQLKAARITCSTVAVSPHTPSDIQTLQVIARATGGRFYHVQDPKKLPQLFIKEAQVVRRSLIVETPFQPRVTDSLSEVIRGLAGDLPQLRGYVLTGPKGGLSRTVLTSSEGDPILATGQSGLGRCVAFTSSIDSRWAPDWVAWGGFGRFWEQAVRYVAKSGQASDCEVFADVDGRGVQVTVDAVQSAGQFAEFSQMTGQVIAPDLSAKGLALTQVGPGRYRGNFQVDRSGSYLVNVRYAKAGENGQMQIGMAQAVVNLPFAPEYRDLKDNHALLVEVAKATGGRVLGGDPAAVDLFSREGVEYPKTALPLIKPLVIAWLILFLLDVAVRRVAFDFRAALRRLAVVFRPGKDTDGARRTLQQLRSRRRQVQEGFSSASAAANTAARYAGGEAVGPAEMPLAEVSQAASAVKPAQQAESAKKEDQQSDHLDRLLRAKKIARDRMSDESKEKEKGHS